MFEECSHVLISGQKCQAPAVKGSTLCRHHQPHKRARADRRLVLPPLNDQCSVLCATVEIVQAMAERRMKRSDAATLLYGLRLTANLMHDIENAAEKAYAGGLDSPWEPGEADSSLHSRDPRDLPAVDEMDLEEAKAMLAALQTSSVDEALDQWEAKHPKHPSRAPKANAGQHHPPSRFPQASPGPNVMSPLKSRGRSPLPSIE